MWVHLFDGTMDLDLGWNSFLRWGSCEIWLWEHEVEAVEEWKQLLEEDDAL